MLLYCILAGGLMPTVKSRALPLV
uniref:Uncharacterized protein n=1 Tax=Anguilla anguilla TaxID=7936 RepID=A0A0E9T4C6_ANGAN